MEFNEVIELVQAFFMIIGLLLILPFVFTIKLVRFVKE